MTILLRWFLEGVFMGRDEGALDCDMKSSENEILKRVDRHKSKTKKVYEQIFFTRN